ncbi:class I SAM-dependent methyltransferase [bacterium]|nr:MAG: class I SAM-dependent methyltransferase [bacterium]
MPCWSRCLSSNTLPVIYFSARRFKDSALLPYLDKRDPWSSHAIIFRWIKERPADTTLLDIGTASGTLGRLCQGLGITLNGIEPNPEWAEMARPYYREIFIGSLQEAPAAFINDANVIVLADVLEHLPEPLSALRDLVEKATPGCTFMLSVPNVANLSVRLALLFGHFDYAERGILDRTHLHFFTSATFFKLLGDAGLEIQRRDVTPVPLNLVHPFFEKHAFGRWIHHALSIVTGWFSTLLGYQFVVMAVKR